MYKLAEGEKRNALDISMFVILFRTKPPGMKASIFDACPKPR